MGKKSGGESKQAWHTNYMKTCTGYLKVFQITCSILACIILLYINYEPESNHLIMGGHSLILTLVTFGFATTTSVIFLAILLGSIDVPYTIFYRIHAVLGSVAFIISSLTYMVQEADDRKPDTYGMIAAAVCVLISISYFADAVLAYEFSIDGD